MCYGVSEDLIISRDSENLLLSMWQSQHVLYVLYVRVCVCAGTWLSPVAPSSLMAVI